MFSKQINLSSYETVKENCNQLLNNLWNFRSEKIFRISHNDVIFQLLNNDLKSIGMPDILGCTIFARGPGHIQKIHCDSLSNGEIVNSAVIIPILGTIGSKFQWFDTEGCTLYNVPSQDNKSYLFFASFPYKPLPIHEIEVDNPIIANVRIPHRAVANNTSPRAVISIKFNGNPLLI